VRGLERRLETPDEFLVGLFLAGDEMAFERSCATGNASFAWPAATGR
jgi:hypothetical protein